MTGDTCPTCGQPMPGAALPDDCLCSHGKREHHVTEAKNVTYCYRHSCGCTKYQPLELP